MNFPDFYAWLGVSPDARIDEIKHAWKKLAIQFHPDRNPGDPHPEDNMKAVNIAYQTLSNPERRAKYDLARLQALQPVFYFATAVYSTGTSNTIYTWA